MSRGSPQSPDKLLADLTPAQREAVTHYEGPLLILAGAGSGKTRVITRRVAWLLQQGVRPSNILAITFTNKAAGEMRQRVEALVPDSRVWVSTFHALGARLLRQYGERVGLDRNFTIYDQTDRNKLVKLALEAANIDNARFTPETIQSAISKAKNQLLTPEKYAAQAHDFFGKTVAHVYPVYEKRMRDANALDFDDLLFWPALALKNDPELRAELDARFRFVLIDEYQDTNKAQYGIARGLSVDQPNLCVVGDPDQCLPPGTMVDTPSGPRPIETLVDGDRILSAKGWGKTSAMWIDKVMVNPYKGRLIRIRVEGGVTVRATPNHICFALLQPTPQTHFVYLMWKNGVGYRLGTTRGVRTTKDGVIASGLQVRTNQEVADAVWLLRTCPFPGSVTRGAWARRHVLMSLFGDHRCSADQTWHYHRVQMVTSGKDLRVAAASRFSVRDGSKGTWRIETSRKHHADALSLAQEIGDFHDTDVINRARLTSERNYPFMPAGHIHPGMLVPVLVDGQVVDRRVEAVEWEDYEGPVYDLSIPETHNFIANGLVVHNSIYKFRGSDIRNILDFERDFPDARVITLDRNYRSTKSILQAASHLIAHNKQRKPKDLLTDNPAGQPVTVVTFETGLEEADGVVRRIRDAVQAGKHSYRDYAIFLRINALSRSLETAFVKLRVPFQIVRGLAFYDRKENRDVLAYLRLLLNPRDEISFLRVVNEPARGIGKVSLERLQEYAEPREMSLLSAAAQVDKIPAIKGKAVVGLREFAKMMAELTKLADAQPDEVIRQVLDRTGYRQTLKDSHETEDQERLANIEEFITAAKQFVAEDANRTLSDFLESITLASDVDSWDEKQDCVSVMTLHASKGLEFPVVYMLAVEQGLLPHERSLHKDEEIEEERRLAFVGMTRAKQELYLSYARLREFRGQTLYTVPSMFLEELPGEGTDALDLSAGAAGTNRAMAEWRGGSKAAEEGWADAGIPIGKGAAKAERGRGDGFAVGVLVKHDTYGVGKITDLSGYGAMRKVKIRFPTAGERTFLVDKAKLEIVQKS